MTIGLIEESRAFDSQRLVSRTPSRPLHGASESHDYEPFESGFEGTATSTIPWAMERQPVVQSSQHRAPTIRADQQAVVLESPRIASAARGHRGSNQVRGCPGTGEEGQTGTASGFERMGRGRRQIARSA